MKSLGDGSCVQALAIKKLESAPTTVQEEESFLEAVASISRLRHSNIVPLLGYCSEHGQRLLVHEFIGNGTLQEMLHNAGDGSGSGSGSGRALPWSARMKVALGTARALEWVTVSRTLRCFSSLRLTVSGGPFCRYLHEVCVPPVVHKNVKSANILLDGELNPYLSDCGLASLIPTTERQVKSAA